MVAEVVFDHFHGTLFSGLMGGAVETYSRSEPWKTHKGPPRAIPFDGSPVVDGMLAAELIVIVPVLGIQLAREVQEADGPWFDYLTDLVAREQLNPERVRIMPVSIDSSSRGDTTLGKLFGEYQQLSTTKDAGTGKHGEVFCRDLSQAIAQFAGNAAEQRITVFVSHTKRSGRQDGATVVALVDSVRRLIADTRLASFFDAQDLQVGSRWAETLRTRAASSAFLGLRTELYASREWCQKEIRIAKLSGMPVVILEALQTSEERGSFLMDHVPRVAAHELGGMWNDDHIRAALSLLVDECLKRVLWKRQHAVSAGVEGLEVDWWAPHAPEALTLVQWLTEANDSVFHDGVIRILHPDPPLGSDEQEVLQQVVSLTRKGTILDMMTPRMLAVRGL